MNIKRSVLALSLLIGGAFLGFGVWVNAQEGGSLVAQLFGRDAIVDLKTTFDYQDDAKINPEGKALQTAPLTGKVTTDRLTAQEYNRLLELTGKIGSGETTGGGNDEECSWEGWAVVGNLEVFCYNGYIIGYWDPNGETPRPNNTTLINNYNSNPEGKPYCDWTGWKVVSGTLEAYCDPTTNELLGYWDTSQGAKPTIPPIPNEWQGEGRQPGCNWEGWGTYGDPSNDDDTDDLKVYCSDNKMISIWRYKLEDTPPINNEYIFGWIINNYHNTKGGGNDEECSWEGWSAVGSLEAFCYNGYIIGYWDPAGGTPRPNNTTLINNYNNNPDGKPYCDWSGWKVFGGTLEVYCDLSTNSLLGYWDTDGDPKPTVPPIPTEWNTGNRYPGCNWSEWAEYENTTDEEDVSQVRAYCSGNQMISIWRYLLEDTPPINNLYIWDWVINNNGNGGASWGDACRYETQTGGGNYTLSCNADEYLVDAMCSDEGSARDCSVTYGYGGSLSSNGTQDHGAGIMCCKDGVSSSGSSGGINFFEGVQCEIGETLTGIASDGTPQCAVITTEGTVVTPTLMIELNNDTDEHTAYQCAHDIDLQEYCGDEDGCSIRLVMNHKTNGSDLVHVIDEHIYMEESESFSSNNGPDGQVYGTTRQGGGGDYGWINGTGTRTDHMFSPWDWAWMSNYKSNNCTQSGNQPYPADEPYKFSFMTHPDVRTRIFVEDGYDYIKPVGVTCEQRSMADINDQCYRPVTCNSGRDDNEKSRSCTTSQVNLCQYYPDMVAGDKFTITSDITGSDWINSAPVIMTREFTFGEEKAYVNRDGVERETIPANAWTTNESLIGLGREKSMGHISLYDGGCLIRSGAYYRGDRTDSNRSVSKLVEFETVE